ncbi:hypothetical protein HDU76_012540 [Blyttiomyces sp. JEL0837]|nr:hypothetical protein HDU76_012540 [Blyttiomyces sp. JEL0837]
MSGESFTNPKLTPTSVYEILSQAASVEGMEANWMVDIKASPSHSFLNTNNQSSTQQPSKFSVSNIVNEVGGLISRGVAAARSTFHVTRNTKTKRAFEKLVPPITKRFQPLPPLHSHPPGNVNNNQSTPLSSTSVPPQPSNPTSTTTTTTTTTTTQHSLSKSNTSLTPTLPISTTRSSQIQKPVGVVSINQNEVMLGLSALGINTDSDDEELDIDPSLSSFWNVTRSPTTLTTATANTMATMATTMGITGPGSDSMGTNTGVNIHGKYGTTGQLLLMSKPVSPGSMSTLPSVGTSQSNSMSTQLTNTAGGGNVGAITTGAAERGSLASSNVTISTNINTMPTNDIISGTGTVQNTTTTTNTNTNSKTNTLRRDRPSNTSVRTTGSRPRRESLGTSYSHSRSSSVAAGYIPGQYNTPHGLQKTGTIGASTTTGFSVNTKSSTSLVANLTGMVVDTTGEEILAGIGVSSVKKTGNTIKRNKTRSSRRDSVGDSKDRRDSFASSFVGMQNSSVGVGGSLRGNSATGILEEDQERKEVGEVETDRTEDNINAIETERKEVTRTESAGMTVVDEPKETGM